MPKNKIVTVEDIALRNVDECLPYENNPRHNEQAVDAVATSIKEFGFNIPIILDENDVIVTGHTRILAAKKLGMKQVPTISADHLTEDQIRAFRIADNRLAENSTWDEDLLVKELSLLNESSFGLDLTGFSEDELACYDLDLDVSAAGLDDLVMPEDKEVGAEEDPETDGTETEKSSLKASRRIGISVGGYKLFVSKEQFHEWETSNLEKYGSKADLIRSIAERLGLPEAEFDQNT